MPCRSRCGFPFFFLPLSCAEMWLRFFFVFVPCRPHFRSKVYTVERLERGVVTRDEGGSYSSLAGFSYQEGSISSCGCCSSRGFRSEGFGLLDYYSKGNGRAGPEGGREGGGLPSIGRWSRSAHVKKRRFPCWCVAIRPFVFRTGRKHIGRGVAPKKNHKVILPTL